jgi:hypothetical protein
MHDDPEATEEEQEQPPGRHEDEHAMRAQGHEDPEHFRDGDGDEEEDE